MDLFASCAQRKKGTFYLRERTPGSEEGKSLKEKTQAKSGGGKEKGQTYGKIESDSITTATILLFLFYTILEILTLWEKE